jgi:hypothetical protein
LELFNYPITGPIISGPHEVPFICQTQDFTLPDRTMLGPPTDSNCSAPTKITYLYMPIGGTAFKPSFARHEQMWSLGQCHQA